MPRTTQYIYISRIKHLTRTLNTYSKYEGVEKIWVSFDKSCGKYHLTLNDDIKVFGIKYELVYDKLEKNQKLKSIDEITKVINSKISQRRQRLSVLVDFLNLVRQYNYIEKDGKTYNKFFFQDEEKIFRQISLILPELKDSYEYDHKDNNVVVKRRKVNTNIEKKFFNFFYHQLIYQNLDKVKFLEEDRNTEKQNVEDLVNKEMTLFKELTGYLQNQIIYSSDSFLSSQKELLISAIENYDNQNDTVSQFNSTSYSKEDLEAELEVLEGLIDKEDNTEELEKIKLANAHYIKKVNEKIDAHNLSIEIQLKKYLKDYIQLVDYIIKNEKNFTKNSITRYFVSYIVSLKKARSKTGLKRKKKVKEEKDRFDLIDNLEDNEKYYFQLKALEINKYIKENKDRNKFLAKHYHIELDITDKDWKNAPFDCKSKKEYIKFLKDEEEHKELLQEMHEYEETQNNIVYEKKDSKIDESYNDSEFLVWLNEQMKYDDSGNFEDYLYFLENFDSFKSDYEYNVFEMEKKRVLNNLETIKNFGIDKIYSLLEEMDEKDF